MPEGYRVETVPKGYRVETSATKLSCVTCVTPSMQRIPSESGLSPRKFRVEGRNLGNEVILRDLRDPLLLGALECPLLPRIPLCWWWC